MDKKKIRKDLTSAHKAIKPITTKLSHKDLKHVNDGMQYLENAFKKTNDSAQPDAFLKKEHVSADNSHVWNIMSQGVTRKLNTQDMFQVIKDAKSYIKMKY